MNLLRNLAQTFICALLVMTVLLVGIIVTANLTILNPDFVIAEMHKLDVYSRILDEVKGQFTDIEMEPLFDSALEQLRPWLEEQTDRVIHAGYAYLKEGEELNIVISLEPVRDVVRNTIEESASSYLPSGYDQLMPGLFDTILDQITNEVTSFIPAQFTINESVLGAQIRPYVEQVRHLFTYMKITYILSVFFVMLSILLLALLHRWKAKPVSRAAGASFMLAGIASIVIVLAFRFTNTAVNRFASEADTLFGLQQVLAQIIRDATTPLLIYSIAFIAAGAALIAFSFFFKERPPYYAASDNPA